MAPRLNLSLLPALGLLAGGCGLDDVRQTTGFVVHDTERPPASTGSSGSGSSSTTDDTGASSSSTTGGTTLDPALTGTSTGEGSTTGTTGTTTGDDTTAGGTTVVEPYDQCMMQTEPGNECEECICDKCLTEWLACQEDEGCLAIRACALLNTCAGVECLWVCEPVHSKYGGLYGPSGALAIELGLCATMPCGLYCDI